MAGSAGASTLTFEALCLLCRLGWRYVDHETAARWRGSAREPLLKQRLVEVLQTRRFDYKGQSYPLSPHGIDQVVRALSSVNLGDGLLPANQRVYGKLALGITVTEFMPDGKRHQPTIALIDWNDPAANRWDVTDAMPLLCMQGQRERTLDLVCYVNGVPLAVVQAGADAVARLLHQQRPDELPHLHAYVQLLLALRPGDARYGTTGTPQRLWARWRDEEHTDVQHAHWKSAPLDAAMLAAHGRPAPQPTASIGDHERLVASLLQPARLLELLRFFILFDRRVGKIVARHQQFFGVRALLRRISERRADGGREGGIAWHTAGSGKSYTMVFLTRALLLRASLKACRVVVVTDRVDLEEQLAGNFINSGAFGSSIATRKDGEKARAASGRELARRIGRGTDRIVFSLVHKFNTASRLPECYNPSADLVVLVDEGHRSHGGLHHERMRRSLPRAAYVAFTGTPLLRGEKANNPFGPIVHAYTLPMAVDDGAVVPLLYEARVPELSVDEAAATRWFEHLTAQLPHAQAQQLKWRFADQRAVHGAAGRIQLIAWDIALHFDEQFKQPRTGLKGQIATASKRDAIRYKQCLDATGLVSSAVVISAPESPEGDVAPGADPDHEVQQWWRAHVGRHATTYERQVLAGFAGDEAPDLLIVVDRLLTGFDAPRNAVLYIDKPLKQHALIQAVARVNRPWHGKRHGLLVDYRGVLQELDVTLQAYQDLQARMQAGYDAADLEGLYRPVARVQETRVPAHTPSSPEYQTAVRQLRRVVDEHVHGVKVREPQATYRVDPGSEPASDIARWSDERLRREAALLRGRVTRTIEVDLAGDARAQQVYGDLLAEAVQRAEAAFDQPRRQYAVWRDAARRVAQGEPLADEPARDDPERICFDILQRASGEDGFHATHDAAQLRAEAQTMAQVVRQALTEHSLHPADGDAAIRRALLPQLYPRLGLERARLAIEQVIRAVREA